MQNQCGHRIHPRRMLSIGMKKSYRTVFDCSAQQQETMVVSGGKIGFQIENQA